MSNLIQINNSSISVREKRTELSLMLRKIVIKLSSNEFEVFEQLVLLWINSKKCESLEEKALYVLVFSNLYKNKIMPNLLKIKKEITLNLSIPEAYALEYLLGDIYLNNCPYEEAFIDRINSDIHRQTV